MTEVLSRLRSKTNKQVLLKTWLDGRPKKERDEWYEALRHGDLYTNRSIANLLKECGVDYANDNVVYRLRTGLEGYVAPR